MDMDEDAVEEVLLSGNLFSNNVIDGPFCSSLGAVMEYDSGEIQVFRGSTGNGFLLRGDRKALGLIKMADGPLAVISTTNNGSATLLQLNAGLNTSAFRPEETKAIIRLSNGKELLREAYYGSGYLSQHSRVVILPPAWEEVIYYTADRKTRNIKKTNL